MKSLLFKFTALFLALFVATNSFAAKGNKKAAGFRGKLSAIAEGSITVSNKKLGDKTYKTDAGTKVLKADGTAGALSDLKTGSPVRVATGADAEVATEIQIIQRKKKNKAAAAPSATPAASATPAPVATPVG